MAGQWQWCKARSNGVDASVRSAPSVVASPASFPLLLVFVGLAAATVPVPVVGRVAEKHLVESFESLVEVVLEGGQRGADGGRAEAVRDEGEVGEAALDARLQDGAGPGVAQGSPILGQQVCELLTQLSAREEGGAHDVRRELRLISGSNATADGRHSVAVFSTRHLRGFPNMTTVFLNTISGKGRLKGPPRNHGQMPVGRNSLRGRQ